MDATNRICPSIHAFFSAFAALRAPDNPHTAGMPPWLSTIGATGMTSGTS
jgi:hypothetical protein